MDLGDAHLDGFGQAQDVARVAADEALVAFVVVPGIGAEVFRPEQALNAKVRQVYRGAVGIEVDDHTVHRLTDVLAQEVEDEDGLDLVGGFFGVLLGAGDVQADVAEVGDVVTTTRLPYPSFEVILEHAVNQKVGITTDRTGEVAVLAGRQGVVTYVGGAVAGPGETAKDKQVDGELQGGALNLLDDPLQIASLGPTG